MLKINTNATPTIKVIVNAKNIAFSTSYSFSYDEAKNLYNSLRTLPSEKWELIDEVCDILWDLMDEGYDIDNMNINFVFDDDFLEEMKESAENKSVNVISTYDDIFEDTDPYA